MSSSAIFFVSAVTSTLSPRAITSFALSCRISTCLSTSSTSYTGSSKPVGRINCSAVCVPLKSSSFCAGVAETNKKCGALWINSSYFKGRLSSALGRRNPYSTKTSLRLLSPAYIPPNCGKLTWLSSTMSK